MICALSSSRERHEAGGYLDSKYLVYSPNKISWLWHFVQEHPLYLPKIMQNQESILILLVSTRCLKHLARGIRDPAKNVSKMPLFMAFAYPNLNPYIPEANY